MQKFDFGIRELDVTSTVGVTVRCAVERFSTLVDPISNPRLSPSTPFDFNGSLGLSLHLDSIPNSFSSSVLVELVDACAVDAS